MRLTMIKTPSCRALLQPGISVQEPEMGHYTLAVAPSAKIFILAVSVQNLCVERFSLTLVVAVAALSPVFAKSQAPAGTAKKPLERHSTCRQRRRWCRRC